jgi:hypothetical protein
MLSKRKATAMENDTNKFCVSFSITIDQATEANQPAAKTTKTNRDAAKVVAVEANQEATKSVQATQEASKSVQANQEAVKATEANHPAVKATEANQEAVKATEANHPAVKATEANQEAVKATEANHPAVKATEANQDAVKPAEQVAKDVFVKEVVANAFFSETELVPWANTLFELSNEPGRLARAVMLSQGLQGLDSLLLGAKHINKQDLVQEIVKQACEKSKVSAPVYQEEHERIYSELAKLPDFPPVGREFPNVDRLCSLCAFMPAILTTKTGVLFFQELVGKVDQLYAFGNTLSTMKDINHPSCLHCTYATDAMSDTTKFVVLISGNTKYVVALQPGQQVVASDKFDDKIHNMVASIDGPFDEARTKLPRLQASFDGQHLLWVHNKADPDVACFAVINAKTQRLWRPHTYYASTSSVWWASNDMLGLKAGTEATWQSVKLSDLAQVPQKLVRPYRGTKGVITDNEVVGIEQHGEQVRVARWNTQDPSCEFTSTTLKSTRQNYWVEDRHKLCNDVLDVVPHPVRKYGVYVNVKTVSNVLKTFWFDGSSSKSEPYTVTKAEMMKNLFRQVWPAPSPAL